MKALSSMDRVKQVEAMSSYNAMKGRLTEFLRAFATEGKTVKAEDIHGFFEGMQGGRKRSLDGVPMPNCK